MQRNELERLGECRVGGQSAGRPRAGVRGVVGGVSIWAVAERRADKFTASATEQSAAG